MSEVLCPMCHQPIASRDGKRGVLINRIATIGSRMVELRTKLTAVPRGELHARMYDELERLIEEQRVIRDELDRLKEFPVLNSYKEREAHPDWPDPSTSGDKSS